MRVVALQLAVTTIIGLLFLVQGFASAIAAWCGGLVVVIGTALLALRVFAPPLAGPGATLGRFAVGMLLKWVIVLGGFYLILAQWRLPPVPALSGFGVALAVNLVALKFKQ